MNPKDTYWNTIITRVKQPDSKQTVWDPTSDFAVVIVEPREHPWLKYVLYNMAHIYDGISIGLIIYHGTKNRAFLDSITEDWTGVVYCDLGVENLTISDYNNLLVSPDFWDFTQTHVLIFQADTFIRRKIPQKFFQWDYVGAPWVHNPKGINKRVGNGGFSLRRVSAMKDITLTHKYSPITDGAEDVYFSRYTQTNKVPSVEIAREFSIEVIYHNNPCGLHKAWQFHKPERIQTLVTGINFLI